MSEQIGYSPSFKRPAEIMRMRRKRARSEAGSLSGSPAAASPSQGASSPAGVRPFSPGPLFNSPSRSGGVKRRNPFANIENTYSPSKKLHIYNEEEGNVEKKEKKEQDQLSTKKTEPVAFAARLREAENKERQQLSSKKSLDFSEDDSLFDEKDEDLPKLLLKSPPAIAPASIAPPVCTEYPADWSLKTRVLFTSPLSLSWAEKPKAQEEAVGLSQHCRAQYSTLPHSIQDAKSCSELRCSFQQSLVYWQHPSLPWLSLFPRINAERSFTGKSAPWSQDSALQQSLMSEWSVSLSSLYSLLKTKLCPYFYLCSYQFTVLFKAAGLGGSGSITALISPTTRGLREAMKAEGIEFSLPLVDELRKSKDLDIDNELDCGKDKDDDCCGGEEEEEDDDGGEEKQQTENDDEDMSWLKEMGVQDKIKKPDSISIQLRKEGHAVSLDHKPESVVLVEGSDTFTLINFLINCKSLVASTGSQAGLPPTLLAPVAFRGAAMQTLRARSVNVKSQVGMGYQNISSLEITGPILPSSLHSIVALLRPAQKGNFSSTLYTHAPTAVMNVHKSKTQSDSSSSADLSSCGLRSASVQQLQTPSTLGKTALNHLNMNNYSYTWKN
ncbi:hypothetical protein WMY93_032796 [Mugilogobius chulae]|uniref:Downstream neighbor of SON n=1 Tax=Mugilogobius chulae TaxID=88201 RepID=A0AAW0MN05_9GOBI